MKPKLEVQENLERKNKGSNGVFLSHFAFNLL